MINDRESGFGQEVGDLPNCLVVAVISEFEAATGPMFGGPVVAEAATAEPARASRPAVWRSLL